MDRFANANDQGPGRRTDVAVYCTPNTPFTCTFDVGPVSGDKNAYYRFTVFLTRNNVGEDNRIKSTSGDTGTGDYKICWRNVEVAGNPPDTPPSIKTEAWADCPGPYEVP
jgi:hypothetical protein